MGLKGWDYKIKAAIKFQETLNQIGLSKDQQLTEKYVLVVQKREAVLIFASK